MLTGEHLCWAATLLALEEVITLIRKGKDRIADQASSVVGRAPIAMTLTQ